MFKLYRPDSSCADTKILLDRASALTYGRRFRRNFCTGAKPLKVDRHILDRFLPLFFAV